jgi:DNA-binding response OmpR family regulator
MSFPGHNAVILCIDDQRSALESRQLILQRAGYTVFIALDGVAGLVLFRREHIDLVITDHLLSGQTGCQVAAEMKRLKPEVPVAMLSGLAEPPEGVSAMDAYFVKGMPIPEFLAAVARLVAAA